MKKEAFEDSVRNCKSRNFYDLVTNFTKSRPQINDPVLHYEITEVLVAIQKELERRDKAIADLRQELLLLRRPTRYK
jgi:hypothetical protein